MSKENIMYARVVAIQVKPGMLQKAIQTFQESIVPAAKSQKGFKNIYLLTDSHADKATSVSIWESEADLRESEASGYYQEQIAKVSEFLIAPPSRDLLEVSVHD
jgi:heme-degrading monooxygenase HmoA